MHIITYRPPRIGAGTGIFTRALLDQNWSSDIKDIKAIEPSAGMREVFSKTVSSNCVTLSINEGTFDATNIEDQWGDLVVIAQVSSLHVKISQSVIMRT
jgi:phospholipid N-methyltransferase